MLSRGKFRSSLVAATALALASLALATGGSRPAAAATTVTTAWHDGSFAENTAGVVSRSDVVIKQPNFSGAQFLPLGNGSLGVAAWASNGFPTSRPHLSTTVRTSASSRSGPMTRSGTAPRAAATT